MQHVQGTRNKIQYKKSKDKMKVHGQAKNIFIVKNLGVRA
jgi:hypothetical protein